MGALGLYLSVSIVVLAFVVIVMIGYGSSHKEPGIVGVGVGLGFVIVLLFEFGVEEYHEPKAIDVYRGKTVLEYTMRNGVVVDSAVIYKTGVKR